MQRLLYIIVYPLVWLISILPLPILYVKSTVLFFLVYYIIGYRKKTVLGNLKLVFPSKSDKEIQSIAKKFYQHLCDLVFETVKSITISEKELTKRYQIQNMEVLEDLYQKEKSVLLMCGHYANWEWSGIFAAHMPHKGFAVYKKLDNPYFDKLVKSIRGRFGGTIVTNKQIAKTLFKSFKKQERSVTLIVSDQTPKIGAFKYRDLFMGIDVPIFTGTEELAKMLDFACVYLQVEKVKRGHYKATLVPLSTAPKTVADFGITRSFLDAIENQIREAPAYYLWSHKRWKHRN